MKVYVTNTSAELFTQERQFEFTLPSGWRVPCKGETIVTPTGEALTVHTVTWHAPPDTEVHVYVG